LDLKCLKSSSAKIENCFFDNFFFLNTHKKDLLTLNSSCSAVVNYCYSHSHACSTAHPTSYYSTITFHHTTSKNPQIPKIFTQIIGEGLLEDFYTHLTSRTCNAYFNPFKFVHFFAIFLKVSWHVAQRFTTIGRKIHKSEEAAAWEFEFLDQCDRFRTLMKIERGERDRHHPKKFQTKTIQFCVFRKTLLSNKQFSPIYTPLVSKGC
jgi:hypothetical protein